MKKAAPFPEPLLKDWKSRGLVRHDAIGVFVLLFGELEVVFLFCDDADELWKGRFPVLKDFLGTWGVGLLGVGFDEGLEFLNVFLALDGEGDDHLGVEARLELTIDVVDVSGSTRHSGSEVLSGKAEDNGESVGHVFATVIAYAFTNGCRSGVSDAEALTGSSIDEEVATSRSVETGVSNDGVLCGFKAGANVAAE